MLEEAGRSEGGTEGKAGIEAEGREVSDETEGTREREETKEAKTDSMRS